MKQTTGIRFLKYLGIGAVAFLIDAAAFQAMVGLAHVSPYVARLVSFVVTVTAAWWLNRTFTFADAGYVRPDVQWARYFAANLVGGSVNYATFALVISTLPVAADYPLIALAAGSVAGLVFNFTAYRRFVFRTDAEV